MRPTWLILTLLTAMAVVLTSCGSPKIKTQVTMPANSAEATKLRKIAILPFDTKSGYEGDFRQDVEAAMIQVKVDKKAYFEVYEREQVEKIMTELAFGQSGMVDEDSASEVGKMIGANGIYFGSVVIPRISEDLYMKTVQQCTGSGKKRRCADRPVQCKRKVATMSFTPKLVAVETGRVVFSKKFEKRQESNACQGEPHPVRSDVDMITMMKQHIVADFKKEIAPYDVTLSISLMNDTEGLKGKDEGKFEQALEFANAGRLDRACDIWKGVQKKNGKHPGTLYNVGVCSEIKGDLDGALTLYQAAEKRTRKPVREISDAINRVEKLKGSNKELKSQKN